jgi:quercetin dioxygenase-like cupin family protein
MLLIGMQVCHTTSMQLRKYRWSKYYESAEEELVGLLASKKIDAERWTAESNESFTPHSHALDKTLWCADGSIIFIVEGKKFSLQPGDTLELPANTAHEAAAGMFGAVCYESPVAKQNPSVPA